jgi:hypothetical protein
MSAEVLDPSDVVACWPLTGVAFGAALPAYATNRACVPMTSQRR